MSSPVIMTPRQTRLVLAHALETVEKKIVKYSKYQIQLACQRIGLELNRDLWSEVKTAIRESGFEDSWQNITIIDSDNPELVAALPKIKDVFGTELTDRILSESIVE